MSNTKWEDLIDSADVLLEHVEKIKAGGQNFTIVRPTDVKELKKALRRF